MRADRLLADNISGLLRARGAKQHDLAMWCHHSDVWLSTILSGKREAQFRDLDRIADFFGVATYQLLQPGISAMSERRSGIDRRSGRERRISHTTKLARELEARAHPQRKGTQRDGAATTADPLRTLIADFERRVAHLLSQAESGGQAATPRIAKPPRTPRRRVVGGSDAPTE